MKKIITCFLVLCIALLCFVSCGPDDAKEPTATVFVIGMHDNFPYQSTLQTFRDAIYESCYSYGSVTVVVVDGESYIGADYNINKPNANVDRSKRRMIAEKNTAAIMQKISSLSAKTSEVDTLSALSLAADRLYSSDCTVKNIVLVDSGLSTTGLLNFAASQLIEDSPEHIVDQLEERNALPNLSGIRVETIGLGQTCGKQSPLTEDLKSKLTAIWEEILSASGAADVEINRIPLAVIESAQTLPSVSTITVIRDSLINIVETPAVIEEAPSAEDKIPAEETIIEEPHEAPVLQEVIRFDGASVKFNSNMATFFDKEQAVDVLKPIGEILRDNPNLTVYLAGMTASVGGDGIQLSLERAEAVKSLLLDMGCDDSQIMCVGLGRSDNHLRVNDTDSAGNLIDEKATLNRAVFLFGKDSDTANKLGLN